MNKEKIREALINYAARMDVISSIEKMLQHERYKRFCDMSESVHEGIDEEEEQYEENEEYDEEEKVCISSIKEYFEELSNKLKNVKG